MVTTFLLLTFLSQVALAQNQIIPPIEFKIGDGSLDTSLRLLLLLTILALAPSILIMTTSFIRIVVVLSVLRQALGIPQVPPNQVIISLALFLTFFIMKPVFEDININALQPYMKEQINDQEFFNRVTLFAKDFMLKQTRKDTVEVFLEVAKLKKEERERIKEPKDIPLSILIPAFMVSELTTAFEIVFLLYIPFLIVDIVVASILISMGIIMIPPQIISLPFKIMLFVLANGWELVVLSLVRSYQ
ncbi:flagellar biosynthetic protein FliP [Hydrogenivirga caldilitoris]|uniref:Flagellar biosynthetic protein FliP n=1 Tax=Hydrogenivirga caldilitoris TaxID=246264 RepID=A0A497XTM7_9AQUI|nr:flagellar type III secretion system pore protein FliP [Hydrogenivirga caldilitoris]RLJ71530.1 flagellar biosynthetic protein FliP [Hydrogenivirga caldilitoris]